MTVKASGRSALIIAAGLWACFLGPLQAAEGTDNETTAVSKPAAKAGAPIVLKKYAKSRIQKKYVQHKSDNKSDKVAAKSEPDKKAAPTEPAATDGDGSTAIPSSVANANAQFAATDTPTGNARAMTARANDILQASPPSDAQPAADTQIVAADQLNEVDRALQETKPPAPTTLAMASAEAPVAPVAPVMTSGNDNSTWDQTSLIGKIFIAFGGLLTLASAARMFMA